MVEKKVSPLKICGFYKGLDIHDRQKMRRASLSLLMPNVGSRKLFNIFPILVLLEKDYSSNTLDKVHTHPRLNGLVHNHFIKEEVLFLAE